MSAEFFVTFADSGWSPDHEEEILARLKSLASYVKLSGKEIWLRGQENGPTPRFPYDVRIFCNRTSVFCSRLARIPSPLKRT